MNCLLGGFSFWKGEEEQKRIVAEEKSQEEGSFYISNEVRIQCICSSIPASLMCSGFHSYGGRHRRTLGALADVLYV